MKPWILALSLTGLACAHREQHQEPSLPSFSAPSASFSTAYSAPPTSANAIVIQADLIVRPDTVCFPISIEAREATGAAALAAAKSSLEKLKLATKSDARVDDVTTQMIDDDTAPAWVTVRAVIERPLPEADVFERALVVAEMSDALQPFHLEMKKSQGQPDSKAPKIGIGAASPGLKDTEQHRQRLLDVWAARVKALAKTTDDSTIALLNCSPPGDVRVTGGTLEKIGLTLPIACTIGVQPRSK
jgi:hypothetical protein